MADDASYRRKVGSGRRRRRLPSASTLMCWCMCVFGRLSPCVPCCRHTIAVSSLTSVLASTVAHLLLSFARRPCLPVPAAPAANTTTDAGGPVQFIETVEVDVVSQASQQARASRKPRSCLHMHAGYTPNWALPWAPCSHAYTLRPASHSITVPVHAALHLRVLQEPATAAPAATPATPGNGARSRGAAPWRAAT